MRVKNLGHDFFSAAGQKNKKEKQSEVKINEYMKRYQGQCGE